MMGKKDAVGKDMMTKLRESFSLKSFSSKRFYSSLISKSKMIRMNMNLIDQNDLTSVAGFSSSKFTVTTSGNVSEKNQDASNWQEINLENSEIMNKSAESSRVMKDSLKSGNVAEFFKTEDSLKSSSESGKSKLKISVNHSYQDNSQGPLNQIQTKECSEYESFRCDVCMKYFTTKRTVKRHSIIHNLERHPCGICGKVFPAREHLQRHHRAVHDDNVKKSKCSKCCRVYSSKAGLNRHLKRYPEHVELSP